MSAKHALLGMLAGGPSHPYKLAQDLRGRLGPAWEINSGQLYRAVKRLEAEGLVRPVAGSSGGLRKREFELTADGALELERWLDGLIPGVQAAKSELVARVNLGGPDRREASLELIAAFERRCVEALEALKKQRDGVAIWPDITLERVLRRATITTEWFDVQAQLFGAQHLREELDWFTKKEAVWKGSRNDAETVRQRERAREEMFRRMAASYLDALPGNQPPEQES